MFARLIHLINHIEGPGYPVGGGGRGMLGFPKGYLIKFCPRGVNLKNILMGWHSDPSIGGVPILNGMAHCPLMHPAGYT